MKIPGGYRTIEKTGIIRSSSLLRYRSLPFSLYLVSSLFLPAALRSSTHKSGPYQLLGGEGEGGDSSSQKILITKYDIMGASPVREIQYNVYVED